MAGECHMKMHETQRRKQDTHHIDTAAGFFGTCGRREMQNLFLATTAPYYLLQVYSNVVVHVQVYTRNANDVVAVCIRVSQLKPLIS